MTSSMVVTREVEYFTQDGQRLIGYFAAPTHLSTAPLVIVGPEWWGLNDYIEQRTRELAEHGYCAFALDMYGDKQLAYDATTAAQYMTEAMSEDHLIQRATAGLQMALSQPEVDSSQVAAIGFCFGGKVVLDLARHGSDLKLVATFHGNLSADTPAQQGQFKARVLVAHGEADTMVTLDDVKSFEREMYEAKVDAQIDIYPKAKHGFTNPASRRNAVETGIDVGYDEAAEQSAMTKLYQWLGQTLSST